MNLYRSRMLLLFWLAPLMAVADSPPTHEFTLDNGLKVVVREDHRVPLVNSQLWFKVGSADEAPGRSGLSHVLEHMLFKGSSKTCPGEAAEIVKKLDPWANASTRKDATVYDQTLAPHHLGVAFELMADLISTAHLRAEDLVPEMEVVRNERRQRVEDNPEALALERFETLAFPSSGYRTPIIGWTHDLDRLGTAELRDWYQAHYAPGNATLIVVGDVTLDHVKIQAERYFGPLAARPFLPPLAPRELARPGERKLTLRLPINQPQLLMAFNVPGRATDEQSRSVHALRLMEMLLGGSDSSRLAKHLKLKDAPPFSYVLSQYEWEVRGDSLLIIDARLASTYSGSLDDAEALIWQQLEALRTTAPSADELERARTQLIAQKIYGEDSIQQQASQLGALENSGLSWRLMDQEVAELQKVTPEDIRKAAMTYLTRERLTTAHILVEQDDE